MENGDRSSQSLDWIVRLFSLSSSINVNGMEYQNAIVYWIGAGFVECGFDLRPSAEVKCF